MFKKLSLLALSVAALVAFAVPAVAQGNAIITDSNGNPATTITAVSENTISVTNGGTLNCDTVHLNVHLSVNDTTKATGAGSGTASGSPSTPHHGPCQIEGVGPFANITSISVNHIQLDGGGTGSADFTYTYTTPAGVCDFHGTADVFYAPTSDEISIDGTLSGTTISGNCSTSGVISGDFTVTSGGKPVVIH